MSPAPASAVEEVVGKLTRRPVILDLYCCAGGAMEGYRQAGFDVIGVDIKPQSNYPGPIIIADALGLDPRFIDYFDAIHASPECQGYTELRHAPGAVGRPQMIEPMRKMLIASGKPWVLENVRAAAWAMPGAITLCGTMFGLGAAGCDLHRHRLFQTNWGLVAPGPCQHSDERPTLGVYGGHARIRSARHGGRGTRDAWPNGHKPIAAEAMGMDWATLSEMSEAIPPAYTRYIGEQLMRHLLIQRIAA